MLAIVQNDTGLAGTVHFYDPGSEHVSLMLNPRVSGKTFTFDVDDDYVKTKLSFSMIVAKSGKSAAVKGWGREMLFHFKLVKQL